MFYLSRVEVVSFTVYTNATRVLITKLQKAQTAVTHIDPPCTDVFTTALSKGISWHVFPVSCVEESDVEQLNVITQQ